MNRYAYLRKRYAESLLQNYLKFSPIVGLIGHRQVGKTTLVSQICSAYYTLDDEESLAYLVDSAPEFLRKIQINGTVTIDEAQLMPKLFPALKEWVRKHKKPGQFLLSGSVRFTSQKSIRESLTGRIINLELLPFSINEMSNEPSPEAAFRLHHAREFSENSASLSFQSSDWKSRMKQIDDFTSTGGLPGICFVRDENIRAARLRSQLDTILDRDLRSIYSTRASLTELKLLVASLAQSQQGVDPQFFQYRTRGGVVVPIAVRQGDHVSGWIPLQGTTPNRRELAAGKAFLAAYAESKVIYLNFENQDTSVIDSRQLITSIAEISI